MRKEFKKQKQKQDFPGHMKEHMHSKEGFILMKFQVNTMFMDEE